MRVVFVCCYLLVSLACEAQSATRAAGISLPAKDSSRVIRMRCTSTLRPDNNPIIVLNGLILTEKDFSNIDVSDIARIDVLKNANAPLYSSRNMDGDTILITTKQWTPGRFVIKDRVSGEALPGATILVKSSNHSMMAAAGDSGRVVTDKLKTGEEYNLKVTMMGYRELDSVFRYQPLAQAIFLERDIKECAEATVIAYPLIRCVCITGICQAITHCKISTSDSMINNDGTKQYLFNVYPNPVCKGQNVTIELKNTEDYPVQVKIISLNGQLLLQQQVMKGGNRITVPTDSRWSSGTYFVQLVSGNSQQTGKLIIQ